MMRSRFIPLLALTVGTIGGGLTGCTSPMETYFDNGQALARAGFIAHPANTTSRYTMLNQLPPSQLTFRSTPNDGRIYLYADPISCSCVYMGSQASYQNFQKIVRFPKLNKKLARSLLSKADMETENRKNTAAWDWTAWAPSADPGSNQPKHVIGASW